MSHRDVLEQRTEALNINLLCRFYKEVIAFYDGQMTEDEAIDKIKQNTRHLAKRQLTWFRRYEDMHWINITELGDEGAMKEIMDLINDFLD